MSENSVEVLVRSSMDRSFHHGDLASIDESFAADGIDHQEPPGTDIIAHLKHVVAALRTAFPDIHFEIHDLLTQGDIVAYRATMTGTHMGVFRLMPGQHLPPTGRKVAVPHMYFLRVSDGKITDLWHLWNVQLLLQQLEVATVPEHVHTSGKA